MKFVITIIFLLIASNNVYSQEESKVRELENIVYRIEALKNEEIKAIYLKKYFEVFPSNFDDLIMIYGYNYNEDDTLSLYSESMEHIGFFFKSIDVINDTAFYQKMFGICIKGKWNADAVNYYQDAAIKSIAGDKPLAAYTLATFSENDISSIWYFLLDGPHPDKKFMYSKNLLDLSKQNTRLDNLMMKAYREIIKEMDDRGH